MTREQAAKTMVKGYRAGLREAAMRSNPYKGERSKKLWAQGWRSGYNDRHPPR